VLERRGTYAETRDAFSWRVPPRFNIAQAACDRHAGVRDAALLTEAADGGALSVSFAQLRELSSRLANALAAHGIERGDRVAILLPQCVETAVAHLAAYRMGAVVLPLFTLFGPEAIEYRLADSGARALIAGDEGLAKLHGMRDRLPELRLVLGTDGARDGGVLDFHAELARGAPDHAPLDTEADDPALVLYTSGTTGQPKGVLHAHRVLLGMLPGVEMPHDFFPQPGDRMWTPADWAWAGGLLDVLLPSLFHGVPVLAHRLPKFDPEQAFALLARHGIRNAFMPPTALKIMRGVASPGSRHPYRMRSIGSGGERLSEELLDWGRETFGLTINEFYGQTEINLVVGNCATLMPLRKGSMGRAIPGHEVAVLDEDGAAVSPGKAGALAVRAPDPAMFLRYWNNPAATERKLRRDPAGDLWCLTGDVGLSDADGYLWFHGRDDDVIISAGYRIGPDEIEDCLMRHPAVAMVAVIGVPDTLRGEVVKAFVVPAPGHEGGPALAADIQSFVKSRLSAHEYPRAIEFRDDLPMTVTGKIRRRDLRDAPVP
jgi:acetyl-CoA synthetase